MNYLLFTVQLFVLNKIIRCQENDTLLSVVVIFRHGDRTPIEPYPTDPYRNLSYWPNGLGQLTNQGKVRHYQLGQWFRSRYSNFLPSRYHPDDIYIQSTDVDRTLMSAESNLAGLYPPYGNEIWNPDIKWQPIPIHTVPQEQDNVLSMHKPCPKYDELQKQLFKTPYFRNVTRQLHDLFAYLTRYTGKSIFSLKHLEFIYSDLYIEQVNNLTLPNWTYGVFPQKMQPWASLSFATSCYTQDMARLKAGLLLNEIVQHFVNITQNHPNTYRKFRMYSGHDTTIADVLNSLGLFEYHCPPFASTIIFELRQKGGKPFINIFYKNSTVPLNMTLEGCDFDCEFNKFVSLIKPIALSEKQWEQECYSKGYLIFTVLSFVGLGLTVLALGLYFIMKYSEKRVVSTTYTQLPNEEIS